MEGESSRLVKRNRPSSEIRRLSDLAGHMSGMIQSHMPYPLFPDLRKFSKLLWLSKLTSNISIDMRAILTRWHLQGLLIHAKYYEKIRMDWAAMGALVEILHPQTHTFIFPTSEVTILLEEVELLLGLKKFKSDGRIKVMRMLTRVTSDSVLGSFMPPSVARKVRTQKRIDLQRLAEWVMDVLRGSPDDDHLEGIMKGFTICLAGAILFPHTDNIVEEYQLSAICGIWSGKRVGPAVLVYLYSGLTASSMGKTPFGCALVLNCWIDLHFKFDHREGMPTASKLFQQSPLHHIADVLGFGGTIVNRVPWLRKCEDWRSHFRTMSQSFFTCAPACLLSLELHTMSSPEVELQLIGATEFVLYNAHRCCIQIDIPRHSFPMLTGITPVKKRELGTKADANEAKAIKAIWKTSVAGKALGHVVEECELWRAYVTELEKLRPKAHKPVM